MPRTAVPRPCAAPIRVGIGGWTFAPWRKTFYPAGLPHAQELEYASNHLTTIEINGTFYRHQLPETFATWREATPDTFVFTVKAHRATTHGKNLAESGPAIDRFLTSGLAELGPKLGPILWQFPHTKKFDAAVIETFLAALPASIGGVKLRHSVEARHPTFLDPAWPSLAARHNIAIVIVDSTKQTLCGDATADFIYARLQHNSAEAEEGYASPALDDWATRLNAWSRGTPVINLPYLAQPPSGPQKNRACFAFFISGDKQHAPQAATALLSRLRQLPSAP